MAPLKPLFQITSLLALAGWLMLVCLPFWHYTDELVLGLSVVLLAIIYSWLLFVAMRQRPEPGTGRPGFLVSGVCCHYCANPRPLWLPGYTFWPST